MLVQHEHAVPHSTEISHLGLPHAPSHRDGHRGTGKSTQSPTLRADGRRAAYFFLIHPLCCNSVSSFNHLPHPMASLSLSLPRPSFLTSFIYSLPLLTSFLYCLPTFFLLDYCGTGIHEIPNSGHLFYLIKYGQVSPTSLDGRCLLQKYCPIQENCCPDPPRASKRGACPPAGMCMGAKPLYVIVSKKNAADSPPEINSIRSRTQEGKKSGKAKLGQTQIRKNPDGNNQKPTTIDEQLSR